MVRAFIQARMSSRRFPGKVLAPFRGEPIVRHVLRALERALPDVPRVVVTSVEPSDDPLAAYLKELGADCFRGPLDDVQGRFRAALKAHPCDWVLRICADSPLLDAEILRRVVAARRDDLDLVTTTEPRTFPKGQNAELIRTRSFLEIDDAELDAADREHVTSFLHRRRDRFRLLNVTNDGPSRAAESVAVDTVEDLARLEMVT
ncbi:MAG: cytidylyltransferase domain-containing protein [Polyangia bacterium]